MLQYADRLKIYRQRTCIAEYPLPADGVKNARFSPEGQPLPRYQPRHRKHGSRQEEQRLRALGPEVAAYVDYALQTLGIQRHRFLRELFASEPSGDAGRVRRGRHPRTALSRGATGDVAAHRLVLHERGAAIRCLTWTWMRAFASVRPTRRAF